MKRKSDLWIGNLWEDNFSNSKVLLHWLLSSTPTQRPSAAEAAALLGTLKFMSAAEILEDVQEGVQNDTSAEQQCTEGSLSLESYALVALKKQLGEHLVGILIISPFEQDPLS